LSERWDYDAYDEQSVEEFDEGSFGERLVAAWGLRGILRIAAGAAAGAATSTAAATTTGAASAVTGTARTAAA
jgi:hypothetical protein